jgi:hypothetical protein
MRGVIAGGSLSGQKFVRTYLVDPVSEEDLRDLADRHDYTFVYSLADLGDVEGFTKEIKATQLIALDRGHEELFETLNKNNRYKVRRSYRDPGVEVIGDDQDRERSLDLYMEVKVADGVIPDIEEDFDTVRWINAYYEGDLVAATCWFDSNEVLRAKHIVSTRKHAGVDTALVGRLTRRLFWEACVIGIDEGHRFVDLGGVDIDRDDKSGVAEFKLSFGGVTAPVYVYRRSSPSWADAVAAASQRGRTVV